MRTGVGTGLQTAQQYLVVSCFGLLCRGKNMKTRRENEDTKQLSERDGTGQTGGTNC